jgi:hypothetical protein
MYILLEKYFDVYRMFVSRFRKIMLTPLENVHKFGNISMGFNFFHESKNILSMSQKGKQV